MIANVLIFQQQTSVTIIERVREIGRWNPIFCIPVGQNPNIVGFFKVTFIHNANMCLTDCIIY